jgi:hypothetical protein
MPRARFVEVAACVLTAFAVPCGATVIADIDSSIIASDASQLGRLSRNGIPSDWSSPEPFPGVINLATSYRYETFVIGVGNTPFIQIDFDEIGGTTNLFASAYLNLYDPASPATNYLGDAGFSGDFFGVDPLTFQVQVPVNQNLVVLVNDTTAAGAGVGIPFNVTVEAFLDTNFTESPEPASWLLTVAGLVALIAARRRRTHV